MDAAGPIPDPWPEGGQDLFRHVANRPAMTVDSDDIISIGDDLLERYPGAFSGDFEQNKRKIEQLTELRSRHVRNRVAGYVTRQYAADSG